jgi:hypothetical protein
MLTLKDKKFPVILNNYITVSFKDISGRIEFLQVNGDGNGKAVIDLKMKVTLIRRDKEVTDHVKLTVIF